VKRLGEHTLLRGALAGALLTAALIGILYAGWRLADLPFVPFDLFDWTTRVLPGALIEFVISAMVAVIRGLHLGPTSVVAKMIEQALGIGGLFLFGIVAGVVLFAFRGRYGYLPGLVLGLFVGGILALISFLAGKTAAVPPLAGALWVLFIFTAWGLSISWTWRRQASVSAGGEPAGASAQRINRRQFMIRLAGYTAVITVSGAVVGLLSERHSRMRLAGIRTWSASHELPNAGAAVKPAPGTRPEFTPLERHYRIDINSVPPVVDGQTWRLGIKGLVETPLSLTLDDLRKYEPTHQFITLSCISNPVGGDLIGTTRWTGVSLKRLLPDLRIKPDATHLKIISADGFRESLSLDIVEADERVMLVYAWDGVPLPREHGFPLRIYIPDVHGMKQPKWIESIEAMNHEEPGYWVVRGWDAVARMKTTSVIDAVAVDMDIIKATPDMRVPVGGIAHAGARGISRVEVKVDDGPWQQALLRSPLSGLTWAIWRFDWPFRKGSHTFTVRAFDGTGAPQITEQRPPAPNGASGLFGKTQKF
jgi:DMSO/TMAO reductase YedYZ molybdopterin-dependent catalytic subunit